MQEKVKSLSAEYDMLPRGGRVLCAVSGGPDSMCLLHLLRQLSGPMGFQLCAAHYNHRLRGAESDGDADFVSQMCRRWDIPCQVGSGPVAQRARELGQGLEETARGMRYAFLREAARREGCSRIATAHNANDNLETVLLHLVRGTGLQGLTGIPPRRGSIVRPLLLCSRDEIEACLARENIPFRQDSTNTDEHYSRNRLRAQVIPVLRQLNPRLLDSVSHTVRYLRADNDYLNAAVEEACASARETPQGLRIPASALTRLPSALAPRAARLLMSRSEAGDTDCSAAHLSAILSLARSTDPSASLSLPGGRQVRRIYGDLLFTAADRPPAPFVPVPVRIGGTTSIPGTGWQLVCRRGRCPEPPPLSRDRFWLSCAGQSGPLMLRPRRTGDALSLPHRGGTKTLKKLLIDAKIPRWERELVPVLADDLGVWAAAGLGPHCGRLARPGEAALELYFIKTGKSEENGTRAGKGY